MKETKDRRKEIQEQRVREIDWEIYNVVKTA
jgi:hypothetical protein